MSNKVLILNRGEIAMRAVQAARYLKLKSVLFCTTADEDTLAYQLADEIFLVKNSEVEHSYMDWDQIDKAIKTIKPNYLYPGYGFFSESAKLAELCEQQGVIFIGPRSHILSKLANKQGARELARECGLLTLELPNPPQASDFPILLKAMSGGGGRGHQSVEQLAEFDTAYRNLSERSQKLFQNADLLVEKKIELARHVELQIFGDSTGVIHNLGTRDCSMQRRYQKIIEEGPAPEELNSRLQIYWLSIQLYLSKLGYVGPGTLEFLWDEKSKQLFFLEMNCRIQVEHPVTEQLIGHDLVYHQIATFVNDQYRVCFNSSRGHSLELRIYSEDPTNQFVPSSGVITFLDFTPHPNVRVDMTYAQGHYISPFYDPMIGKVIVTSETRERSILIALEFLRQFTILGVKTNITLLIKILSSEVFKNNKHSTLWLENQTRDFFAYHEEILIPGLETLNRSLSKAKTKGKTWKDWHRK